MADVLFCTDDFAARHGDRLRAVAPDLQLLTLDGNDEVGEADLARITLAFFSHDAWPERAANYFGVVLRAENLTDAEIVTQNQGGAIDLGAPRTAWAGLKFGL